MLQDMWDKLLTPEVVFYMKEVSGDTEDNSTVSKFFEDMKKTVDYKHVVIMATQWYTFDETKQVNLALQFAGEYHASRFIILLDFLSLKFREGKLK